jgi:3-phosphoshikimate 1-carboxyvinyltransferase
MNLASRVRLVGSLKPPGDKSIAHRMALLSALARGTSVIDKDAPGDDCGRTLTILEALGVNVERQGDRVRGAGWSHSDYHEHDLGHGRMARPGFNDD